METLVTARSGVQWSTKGIQTVILYSNDFMLKRRIDRKTDNIFTKFTMRLARPVCYTFPFGWRNRNVTILIRSFDRTLTCKNQPRRVQQLTDNRIRLLHYLLYLDTSTRWNQSEMGERYKANEGRRNGRTQRNAIAVATQVSYPSEMESKEAKAKSEDSNLAIFSPLRKPKRTESFFLPCASSEDQGE